MLRRVVASSALLVTRSLILKFLGMLSTMVLARVLMPEDFGLVAMAMLVVGFIEIFQQTGAGQWVLRAKEVDDDLLQSAWTINLIFRIGLSAITVALAPSFSLLFKEPELISLLHVFALIFILGGLNNAPGKYLLQRDQRYGKLVRVQVIAKIASAVTAVTIAVISHSYWALVVGKGVSVLVNVVGSFWIHDARPAINTRRIPEIFGFSFWFILQSLFGYSRVQLDTLLVTLSFGNAQLGSFHTMKYLAFIPHSQILMPATNPLLREQAKNRDTPRYFAFQHNITFLVGLIIALNISAVMALTNLQLVAVALGNQWIAYREVFFWFCILIPALFLFQHATRVCLIYGNSRTTFLYELLAMAVVFIPLLAVGFDEVVPFTSLRVRLEIVSSLGFVVYTTVRFTNFSNLVHLAWCCTPIAVACATASYSATVLTHTTNHFGFLVVFCGTYSVVFAGTMTGLLIGHWRHQREWAYLLEKSFAAVKIAKRQISQRLN
ncbi:oligosaccharide flippase family protein [Congregibacter variabilis]|uniref:Oligosaccharide flippase family protein n=1 Tax=Congregibacter variabilis TaxID=3081200 RepID=A0ABZ0I7L8_9GAMM|nr:oligosaccharide flippase family protein [Congregibacter sp. IMCC43200]